MHVLCKHVHRKYGLCVAMRVINLMANGIRRRRPELGLSTCCFVIFFNGSSYKVTSDLLTFIHLGRYFILEAFCILLDFHVLFGCQFYMFLSLFPVQLRWEDFRSQRYDSEAVGARDWMQNHGQRQGINEG